MDNVPLCDPWPVSCVDWTGVSPAVTGMAVQAASEWLWALSGRQFGSCPVTVRPCRSDCAIGGGWWWDGWSWPAAARGPAFLSSLCGGCDAGCSCSSTSTVYLGASVSEVIEVRIDGAVIPPSGYALYDGYKLLRIGGSWPLCQTYGAASGSPGVWEVDVRYGAPVPALGEMAMGEAARQFGLACGPSTAECRLPSNVVRITRSGVAQELAKAVDLDEAGLTGLALVDRFLDAVNPDRLRHRPLILNPDDFASPRVAGPGSW